MKAIEYRTYDKSTWGVGDWQSEPDKAQWQDETTGLPCLIVRNHSGALCGYVGVPEGHPAYGNGYDDGDMDVVHGGITFAGKCQPSKDEAHSICHIPGEGEPDHVWWLGFDCAHGWDHLPALDRRAMLNAWEGTYKNIEYVRAEVAKLAAHLKSLAQ